MRPLVVCLLTLLHLAPALCAEGFTGKQIQQFLDDAIAAGGGEVVLPQGRHRLSEPLVIKNATNLRLIGLEAEDTHLLPAKDIDQPFPLLIIEGKTDGVRIAKLTFTSADSPKAFTDQPLIQVRGTAAEPASVVIDRCLFENHGGMGLVLDQVKGCRVTASSFMDLVGNAIQVTGKASEVLIQHNHLTRTGVPAIQLGPEALTAEVVANEISEPPP
jgi:hypothetical protein